MAKERLYTKGGEEEKEDKMINDERRLERTSIVFGRLYSVYKEVTKSSR